MNYLFTTLLSVMLLLTYYPEDRQQVTADCEAGYHQDDVLRLPGGQEVRIVDVNDNYCPCNVQCVWAGYLEVIVRAEGASRGPDTLGWRDRLVAVGDYTLRLGEIYNRPPCGGSLDEEAFCFDVVVE